MIECEIWASMDKIFNRYYSVIFGGEEISLEATRHQLERLGAQNQNLDARGGIKHTLHREFNA